MGQYESGVDSPQSERNADIGTNIAGDEADGKMDGRPDGWREAGRQPATKKKERKRERRWEEEGLTDVIRQRWKYIRTSLKVVMEAVKCRCKSV